MSVLCLNVCTLYVPNIVSLGICYTSWRVCFIQRLQHQNSHYFRCRVWKTKSWQK